VCYHRAVRLRCLLMVPENGKEKRNPLMVLTQNYSGLTYIYSIYSGGLVKLKCIYA
jgi:hypothetical protein